MARLGADAERFLWEEPDLALFRLRQFAEAFTSHVFAARTGGPAPQMATLADQIRDLYDLGHITITVWGKLRTLKDRGNDAVHPGGASGAATTNQFRKDAEACLRTAHELGFWLHSDLPGGGSSPPEFRLPPKPPGKDSSASRIARVEMDLEAARELADERGRLDEAELRIDRVRTRLSSGGFTKNLDAFASGLLQLKCDSVSISIDNHRGRVKPALDREAFQERCRSLVATGDDAVWAAVSEFGNRLAVGELNAYRFKEAEDWCSTLVKAREARNTAGSVLVGQVEIQDWHLGAVLGTRGQARCFLAHLEGDSTWLGFGLEDFARAEDAFVDSSDKQRQRVYQMHAHLERIRLGDSNELPADLELRKWLEEHAAGVARKLSNGDAVPSEVHADLFVIDVVLKAADLLNDPAPSWARPLAAVLARELVDSEPLDHPYEHLCGRLSLLLGSDCPTALQEALLVTAGQGSDRQGLVPLIAKAFVLERAFRENGEMTGAELDDFMAARPAALTEAWNTHGLDHRFAKLCEEGSLGPLRIMPFNYA